MEQILITYYADNARKLHKMIDAILLKFGGLSNKDTDDFYSLANEVFVDIMRRYDYSQPFDKFLYFCLFNKIKSEITKRNREKRKANTMSISMETPVGDNDNEHSTIGDTIASDFNVENAIFEKTEDGYSKGMLLYLSKLSSLQREILRLRAVGYLPNEIQEELQISKKQYADCNAAIHSYRNVSVLF